MPGRGRRPKCPGTRVCGVDTLPPAYNVGRRQAGSLGLSTSKTRRTAAGAVLRMWRETARHTAGPRYTVTTVMKAGRAPAGSASLARLGAGVWCHPATRLFSHEKEQIPGTLHCGRTWKGEAEHRKPVTHAV